MRIAARSRRRKSRAGVATFLAGVVLVSGCAYFNTFYNAKSEFHKAEEERIKRGSGVGIEGYQKCIDKCQLLMRYYPKSKYVDDALFLMGMSRLYRGEYVQSRASFEELTQRFPKSEYVERAYYNMGVAALRGNDPGGAAQAFNQLQAAFPNSKLNVEAVFEAARVRLEDKDYEEARKELRAFMHDHPKSELVPEAQLHVARTYYDEKRFQEAREEYTRVLDMHITPEVRYEAQLNSALSQRALAEDVLSNPALERTRRARYLASQRERALRYPQQHKPQPAPPPPGSDLPVDDPRRQELEGESQSASDTSETEPQSEQPPFQPGARPALPGGETPPGMRPERPPGTSPGGAPTGTDVGTGIGLDEPVAEDTLAVASLSADEQAQLATAEQSLESVSAQLSSLRKPAARLGHQVDLDIEVAVTRALRGEPDDAIEDLDQMARAYPKSDTSARARYEIAEIYRRLGAFDKARTAYDASLKEKRDTAVSDLAQKKSNAILVRAQATDRLRQAPKTLASWKAAQARPAAAATDTTRAAADSLAAHLALQAQFEELASQQLRVAEIDLLELDQPLAALREFGTVLEQYPESLVGPRAAFGMAWIYQHRLHDMVRAKEAYEAVVRDHADSPQAREASDILANWTDASTKAEGAGPSSRP